MVSTKKTRLNEQIRATEVRLIGVDGEQVGIVEINDAMRSARDSGLDLVEISPGAKPPVCRIMDYGKHLFEQRKKQAAAKKKQKQIQIKEIKLRPGTEEGDLMVKVRSILRFLDDGDKVKVTIRFRGREFVHSEIGMHLMQRIETEVGEVGTVEQVAKLEGRQMTMVIGPKKK